MIADYIEIVVSASRSRGHENLYAQPLIRDIFMLADSYNRSHANFHLTIWRHGNETSKPFIVLCWSVGL